MGGGYPIFADGLIGALFLPNLILFSLLPMIVAYNVLFVFLLGFSASGIYVLMRLFSLNRLASWVVGITFAFSGIMMGQLTHLMVLPALSLMPWVSSATVLLVRRKSRFWICFFALVLSQQIFAGFPQLTFISLLFSSGYVVFTSVQKPIPILRFLFGLVLGFTIAAAQILPSYEYLANTTVEEGFDPYYASFYSFPVNHLATFVSPYKFGNPKDGTYPHFIETNGSIFWENIGFFGVIPLLLSCAGIIRALRNKTQINTFMLVVLLMSFLLMTGKHSPLYFIFSFWPFNLFRVPSRFISLFVLALLYFAGYFISSVTHVRANASRYVIIILIIVNSIYLGNFWRTYHGWGNAEEWTGIPDVVNHYGLDQNSKVLTRGAELAHNSIYSVSGWSDMTGYKFLRNTLAPNSAVLWKIPITGVYAGRSLRRPSLLETLLDRGFTLSSTEATVSAKGQKYMNLLSASVILSTSPITRHELILKGQLSDGDQSIYVYDNTGAVPQVYLSAKTIPARTVEEAIRILDSGNFIPGKTVLVENEEALVPYSDTKPGSAVIVSKKADEAIIRVEKNAAKALLVYSDSFYPGWEAFIDGKPATVYAANIKDKAVVVQEGDHTVRFSYNPRSFRLGLFISLQGIVFTILVTVFPYLSFLPGIVSKDHPHGWYHRHSRGRSRPRT